MGVHGLWELLAPVGRRVSVETLAGKKLAIDASIWMVQFIKAMRDEKGEMVRNAHLLGFFRRICKLLFLRTKPVFVFDGGTPALKRRTVIARRRQRDNAQAKVRKTAEKLLLNQLKAMKLKELAKEIENQKQRQQKKKQRNDVRVEKILPVETNVVGHQLEGDAMVSKTWNQEKLDEMLAASIAAEEAGSFANNASTASAAAISSGEEDINEEEEMILPTEHAKIDPAVLASLPQSMQHNLLVQLRGKKMKEAEMQVENRRQMQDYEAKGKKILSDETDMFGCPSPGDDLGARSGDQEKVDEMLAASIFAEETGRLVNGASKSVAPFPSDEEDGKEYKDEDEDEDEEMMLPAMNGEFDPTVLAALPPSMQLDLLVQVRERLIAENRQKYQKVKKDPAKFSELQIQAYLKTVAFRREIDEVQKSAAGRGVGGVQTSRIASEANREFIFSSSFTGDKQVLASAGAQRNGDNQPETPREHPSQSSINSVASTSKSNAMPSSGVDESTRVIDDNIETYLDERGRVRVSRVRAMGIRMTRDLQRNLDLMKEIEQESENSNKIENLQTMISRNKISVPRTFPSKNQSLETSHDGNCESVCLSERDDQFMVKNDASIEVSFEDDGFDGDDDLFAQLVAGNPVNISSADNTPSRKEPSNFHSHCSSEEVVIKEKVDSVSNDDGVGRKFSLEKGNISDDSDVEWEEGVCDFHKSTSLCQADSGRTVSKGHLQEEADLLEAIKRSLDYVRDNECSFVLPQDEKNHGEKVHEDTGHFDQRYQSGGKLVPEGCGTQGNESFSEILNDDEKPDRVAGITVSQAIDSSGRQLKSSVGCSSAISEMLLNKPHERYPGINSEQSMLDAGEGGNLFRETPCAESITPLETSSYIPSWGSEKTSCISDAICGAKMNDTEAEPVCHVTDMISHSPLMKLSTTDTTNEIDFHQNLAAEERIDNHIGERKHKMDNSLIEGNETLQAEVMEGDLEEEMLVLHQEYLNLGDEQRKLERNAESVNGEMFTECQELLQMFGLPYIIAPMEAEAQCAYLELANLVDGVVTDDSDVFLFGARSVYKNIFDDRKYVETYLMKDIEKELGLTREKLIRMALLLGSDYTEGISGIGIVNAFEVVNAFPEEDGLDKFREWIESPDPTILKKLDTDTGSSARKRGPKVSDNGLSCSKHNTEEVSASELNISEVQEQKQFESYMQDIKQIFMDKHRNVSKNWHIPSSFPSEAVISAYSSPQVDKSSEPFTWGKPDHFVLTKLCWGKFGWGSQKVDELLVPVLKEYDKHETQLRLEAFYTFNERFAKIRSKRIKKALKGVTGQQTSVLIDDPLPEASRSKKKRGVTLVEPGDNKSEKPPDKIEESDGQNQSNYGHESTPKQSRKRRNYGEPVPSSEESLEPSTEAEVRQSRNRGSLGNGRGRGRGRGRRVGRGRGKRSSGLETCESSASDSDHDEQEALGEKFEAPDKVRRSARSRKPVNYTLNDFEVEDLEKSADQSEKKCSDDESLEQDLSSAEGVCGDAAAAGHNGKKQRHAEDPALEEGLHGDCLEIGGGFCTGECEISQPDVSQCGDPSQAEVPKDYLKIGGGFCLDEGEEENDQDGGNGPAAASAPGTMSHLSGFMDEGDLDSGSAQSNLLPKDALAGPGKTDAYNTESNQDHLNASSNAGNPKGYVDLPENRKEATGTTTVGGLSAMPFLRRKRRKN